MWATSFEHYMDALLQLIEVAGEYLRGDQLEKALDVLGEAAAGTIDPDVGRSRAGAIASS